jgi:hypothetical protein
MPWDTLSLLEQPGAAGYLPGIHVSPPAPVVNIPAARGVDQFSVQASIIIRRGRVTLALHHDAGSIVTKNQQYIVWADVPSLHGRVHSWLPRPAVCWLGRTPPKSGAGRGDARTDTDPDAPQPTFLARGD